MRAAAASICRRFGASTRGIAAVEFALILPVLMVLFLSTFDAANGIAVYMKVRSASYVLAAITNQYGTGGTYPAISHHGHDEYHRGSQQGSCALHGNAGRGSFTNKSNFQYCCYRELELFA